ncbi:chloride channel protein [Dyadobacter psychrophilus]|uniref:Chloride channel protein, CIC family n=1 Tax=Dyadobacter psychrophilus TaxID=651661 RepID=A0A1T5EFH7_9BACT|nr:chloride channel protein [Dyadobacter psychrophilus]SKB82450.1 chloride channel protein, CIC family [Dyadobacter psychrophilus]
MDQKSYHVKKSKRVIGVLVAAALTGVFSALIADTLKVITEHYEESLLEKIHENPYLIFVLPLIGITTIHMLRRFLFRNKANKGIKEVLDTINKNGNTLPAYKVPSHYFNGFLTVIFGGSTGIEVSTVVATASVGALSSRKVNYLKKYRTDLVCSGLAAGVTALFNAPVAGFLFAFEVFTKRKSKLHTASVITAVLVSYILTRYFFFKQIFNFNVSVWNSYALPYFVLLGIIAGFNAVYLTKSVLFFKRFFGSLNNDLTKILAGSLLISTLVFFFPSLYGEGYAGINHLIKLTPETAMATILSLLLILIFKPLATSITLGAGGDGGVFAPSLFIGAFLGLIVCTVLNHFFGLNLIAVNFMVIGMAAVLSGSIHAPFTAIFLVCAIADNYMLFVPILIASLVSKLVAHFLFPYTVYTYKAPALEKVH